MSNKPKIKGAKPLLTLEANNEFAKLETTNATKAFELLYELLLSDMTQATMLIVMAVERMRQCEPEKYWEYHEHIQRSLILGGAKMNNN